MLLMTAPAANAGALTHKLSSSVQLTVDAAATNVTRLGSTFSISGNGVDTTDGTTVNTISTGAISSGVYAPGTIAATQDTQETLLVSLSLTHRLMQFQLVQSLLVM